MRVEVNKLWCYLGYFGKMLLILFFIYIFDIHPRRSAHIANIYLQTSISRASNNSTKIINFFFPSASIEIEGVFLTRGQIKYILLCIWYIIVNFFFAIKNCRNLSWILLYIYSSLWDKTLRLSKNYYQD